MKVNRIFIAVLFISTLFMASCINDDLVDNVDKDLTNAQIMNQLKISDVSIWNTLTIQGIDLSTLKSSGLKSGQAMQEYPNGNDYYFALFEDLYPAQGDYDFNDIIIRSKLGLEKTASNEITGYVDSKLVNKGGSLPVEIGLMFYKASANYKSFTRIPNEDITVNKVPLVKGAGPWTTPYTTLGKDWRIDFTCKFQGAGIGTIWVAYHIVVIRKDGNRQEILTSGFAPTNVTTTFDLPQWDFLTDKGLPWGLEITAKKFAIPNEKVLFLKAYPDFQKWVETGSGQYKKWYEKPDLNFSKY